MVRIIIVSAAIAATDGVTTAFTVAATVVFTTAVFATAAFDTAAFVTAGLVTGEAALRTAGLRAADAVRCGRVDFPLARRFALADAFFTDLRADLPAFFLAAAAVLADRPAAFTDALLMGW